MTESTLNRPREIAENIARVQERIAAACARAARPFNAVTLCAVTKTRPVEDVLAAIAAGVCDIGENYVQEARDKIPAVRAQRAGADFTCHLIGHLQTNKVKYAVRFADVLQTVDSKECLQEIAKCIQKLYNTGDGQEQSARSLRILIEVNLSGSAGRAGVAPEAALELAGTARETPGVTLAGLMGIAPEWGGEDTARPHFARLREIFEQLPPENRQILSMGMSGDFAAAIAEGATLLRIGTAIFGARI